MPYISNPYAAKARRLAVNDVIYGRCSVSEAARKYGVVRSTIWKWMKRAHPDHRVFIHTTPSRPKHHPNELKEETVARIIQLRKKLKRCAPIIHAHLKAEGVRVSLSSVERVLRRYKLTRKKKIANPYVPLPRPVVSAPAVLVEIDTIHFIHANGRRVYSYALIDPYSRMGYAEYHERISHTISYDVVIRAQKYFGFPFLMVQTDHGAEFSDTFSRLLQKQHILLRHSRVRKPTDNAHVKRFNRTLQEECLQDKWLQQNTIRRHLKQYIDFYNTQRLHLSLNCQTPTYFVSKVLT